MEVKVPQVGQFTRDTVVAESVTLTAPVAFKVKLVAFTGALAPVVIELVLTRTRLATLPEAPAIAALEPVVVMLPPVAFRKNMPVLLTVEPLTATDEAASVM